jgi:hypothetical protein
MEVIITHQGGLSRPPDPHTALGDGILPHRTLMQTVKTLVIRWRHKVEDACITNTGD